MQRRAPIRGSLQQLSINTRITRTTALGHPAPLHLANYQIPTFLANVRCTPSTSRSGTRTHPLALCTLRRSTRMVSFADLIQSTSFTSWLGIKIRQTRCPTIGGHIMASPCNMAAHHFSKPGHPLRPPRLLLPSRQPPNNWQHYSLLFGPQAVSQPTSPTSTPSDPAPALTAPGTTATSNMPLEQLRQLAITLRDLSFSNWTLWPLWAAPILDLLLMRYGIFRSKKTPFDAVCVCVWNIWTDVKLLPSVFVIHSFYSHLAGGMRPSCKRMPTKLCMMVEAESDQLCVPAFSISIFVRFSAQSHSDRLSWEPE